jgi:uncharacterized protein (TIGR02421 family)
MASKASPEHQLRNLVRLLASGKGSTVSLTGVGKLHVERPVPFLCVYREPPSHSDMGTASLVRSEASYLVVRSDADPQVVRSVVSTVVEALFGAFGALLVVEVWRGRVLYSEAGSEPPAVGKPRFRLLLPTDQELGELPAITESALKKIRLGHERAEVLVQRRRVRRPGWSEPLLSESLSKEPRVFSVGIAVEPVYQRDGGRETFPKVLRELHALFARALRRTFHQFSCGWTPQCSTSFQVLGQKALAKTVWAVDKQLAAVGETFDYLLQVTPVNSDQAWREFELSGFEAGPMFLYRPIPIDPILMKRRLFKIPVERIEDPALSRLFREKLDEIDRQITLLEDIGSKRFVQESVQLFGSPDSPILDTARSLLARIGVDRRAPKGADSVSAEQFAARARDELEHYRRRYPEMDARVIIRSDIDRGLMVSQGSLLIGLQSTFPANRVEALIHHEVGTHVLTYYNGKAQPLRQLYSGLAGYETLQEGLAVFAEYLCGELDTSRLRLLAARVVGVDAMLSGASFVEVFRLLVKEQGFQPRTAFTIAMRIFRGGGLTKDAMYLAGLRDLLRYLEKGGALEPLFIGKIGADHTAILRELRLREVLKPPPLIPRFLESEASQERLGRAVGGLRVEQLVTEGAAESR